MSLATLQLHKRAAGLSRAAPQATSSSISGPLTKPLSASASSVPNASTAPIKPLTEETIKQAQLSDRASVATLSVGRDQNSVSIRHDTSVKDAAGAIHKVLQRLHQVLVSALRLEAGPESLNRAVKAIAVARKYVKDHEPQQELSFFPFNRKDLDGKVQPDLFAFLVFKNVLGEELKATDETELCVKGSSDVNKMANAIISIVLDRGQAIMKAGGPAALQAAMSAVINARRRLKLKHKFDLILVPQFIEEDTTASIGRHSKFLRFNILKSELNGPKTDVKPSLSLSEGCDTCSHASLSAGTL